MTIQDNKNDNDSDNNNDNDNNNSKSNSNGNSNSKYQNHQLSWKKNNNLPKSQNNSKYDDIHDNNNDKDSDSDSDNNTQLTLRPKSNALRIYSSITDGGFETWKAVQ